MANPFDAMVARMDAATVNLMADKVTINGAIFDAVESQFVAEMGPLVGDGLSLVVFSLAVSPRKGDAIHWKGQDYIVTRKQLFNGKPQIWIE
ncbi:ATP-binding protein [Leclercia sp. W6]|uniref:ATP-binding protein n=1 Tax=Leclercia sp. W6 TaxID=2282310 RepID=UPI000DF2C5EC|nr:ATP-binding protein [Leclercia sp. W6]AXF59617.1 ATP-binding protein [Leclercia sp. W6]